MVNYAILKLETKMTNPANTLLTKILYQLPHRITAMDAAFHDTTEQTHSLRHYLDDQSRERIDGMFVYRVRALRLELSVDPLTTYGTTLEFFKRKAFLNIEDAVDAILIIIATELDYQKRNLLIKSFNDGKSRCIYDLLHCPLTIERHYVFFTDFDAEVIQRTLLRQSTALAKIPVPLRAYVESVKPTVVQLLNMSSTIKGVFDFKSESRLDRPVTMLVYETHYTGTIDDTMFDTKDGGHIFTSFTVAAQYINSKTGIDGKQPDTGNWLNCNNGRDWWIAPIAVCCSPFATAWVNTQTKLQSQLSELTHEDYRLLGLPI
jgi:hypothetical protein